MLVLNLGQGFKPDYIHLILGFTNFNYLVVALYKDIEVHFCRRVCLCVNVMHDDLHIFSFSSQREHELSRKRHIKNFNGGNGYSLVQFHMKTSFSVCVKSCSKRCESINQQYLIHGIQRAACSTMFSERIFIAFQNSDSEMTHESFLRCEYLIKHSRILPGVLHILFVHNISAMMFLYVCSWCYACSGEENRGWIWATLWAKLPGPFPVGQPVARCPEEVRQTWEMFPNSYYVFSYPLWRKINSGWLAGKVRALLYYTWDSFLTSSLFVNGRDELMHNWIDEDLIFLLVF